MSNENIDIITLANRVANEKENIRQAIETRGVNIPETTPLSDYPAKIMAIDTENTASDVYYRDENFDTSATSFTLPGNYGVVADGALAGYDNLESVDLQYANAVFPEALADNANLASFTGDHLKYVGNNAFASTGLEALNNSHIQRVDNGGFENCKSLESVSLPNCTHAGAASFANDTALESVSLPECTEVGTYAFENDSMLSTVTLPKVERIKANAFSNCANSAYSQFSRTFAVDFPECLTVGNSAFRNINCIASVNLPKCTRIDNYAFQGNGASSAYEINIPEVSYIGYRNFIAYDNGSYSATVRLGSTINLPKCEHIAEDAFRKTSDRAVNRTLIISDTGCVLGGSNFWSGTGTRDAYPATGGLYTQAPINVIGKLVDVAAPCFSWNIEAPSDATFHTEYVVPIDIDFSTIRYLRNTTYNSNDTAFNIYNQGASSSNYMHPYFQFAGGAIDFSSFVTSYDYQGNTSGNMPAFFSMASHSTSSYYYLRQHNVRKIWIPSTAGYIRIGLMGVNSSDPIHIYTDAGAAKSNWYLAGKAMTASDLGSTSPYGVVHTNCTHQDFIDGTYNV